MLFKACRNSGEKRPAMIVASAAAALVGGLAVALADHKEAAAGEADAEAGATPWLLIAAVGLPVIALAVAGVMAFACWRKKQES